MVCFRLCDPGVAVAMDRLVAAEGARENTTPDGPLARRRSQLIRSTLEKTVAVVAPSTATDSLWVLLHLKRKCVLAQAERKIHDELEAHKTTLTSPQFSDWVLPCDDLLGYLDHLLLHERGAPLDKLPELTEADDGDAATSPSPSSSSTTAAAAAEAVRDVYSTVAVVDLALEVLAPTSSTSTTRRSPAVLLQPATLGLLVRDVETLWCWMYLLRHVRMRYLLKRGFLTREQDADEVTRSGRHHQRAGAVRNNSAGKAVNGLPLDEFFHDYELLVSVEDMSAFATAGTGEAQGEANHRVDAHSSSLSSTVADEKVSLHHIRRWLRAIAAEVASAETQSRRQRQRAACPQTHKQCATRVASGEAASGPVASLLLTAAVSPDNNPDRQLKNRRVDVIDKAAMNYFYKQLASRAGRGVNDDGLPGSGGGGGAPHRIVVDGGDVLDEAQLLQNDALYGRRRRGEAETAESFASFMRSASIGLDIHLMSLTGAGVGYYVGHVRGRSTETCILYAVIGLVVMLFVDAALLIIRLGRHDEGVVKQKAKAAKARSRLGLAPSSHTEVAQGMAARLAAAAAAAGERGEPEVTTEANAPSLSAKLKQE